MARSDDAWSYSKRGDWGTAGYINDELGKVGDIKVVDRLDRVEGDVNVNDELDQVVGDANVDDELDQVVGDANVNSDLVAGDIDSVSEGGRACVAGACCWSVDDAGAYCWGTDDLDAVRCQSCLSPDGLFRMEGQTSSRLLNPFERLRALYRICQHRIGFNAK